MHSRHRTNGAQVLSSSPNVVFLAMPPTTNLSFVGLGAATWDAGGLLIAALAQVHHGSFPTEGGELWAWCCYAG
ncbi:hypothetical protein Csa_015614 [Cucumis sativus]|uniref:Uncharacterized protein n=1 Tax=Cucumis sativus TaxID=3659 RepID=A0A0A0K8B6_CUCSA|nr:hypothetical protein Csa_015614 [Cucumis sativus]